MRLLTSLLSRRFIHALLARKTHPTHCPKMLAVVLAVLWVAPFLTAQKITQESFDWEDKKRTYSLFVPSSAQSDRPAPLLLLFHGSGRTGRIMVEKWQDLASKEGIILVGPDAIDSRGWSVPVDGPNLLQKLVESVGAGRSLNSRRMYLFGHSAGANFVLLMSMFESRYFAAAALHAGALSPENLSVTTFADRKIPIAMWVGDRDPYFPLATVRNSRDALIRQGFSVELVEMPNHDHWYYDLAPKINQAAWDFLKKQELPGEAEFKKVQE